MPESHERHQIEELDDLDRLFLTGLQRVDVPEDLTARVLASTVARGDAARSVLAWPWMVAGLVALGLLVLVGYQLGAALTTSGALELLQAMWEDVGLVFTAPGDVAAAVGELIPWGLVGVAGLSAGLLILAAGKIVESAPAQAHSRLA
jgi:hypothetical protein